jgi:hypothetical protein
MNTKFVTSFTNQMAIGEDGWGMIAPYGDFEGIAFTLDETGKPQREIAIQRVTKANCAQMVNSYNVSRRGLTRFLTAAPIFNGHGDAMDPQEARRAPDKSPKGVFAQVAARDDGFFGEPILLPEGAQLVASRRAPYFSVNWMTEPTGETVDRNGQQLKVYEPTEFISAALCSNPRLPVQMLNGETDFADSDEPDDENKNAVNNHDMKNLTPKIIAVLTKHGIQFTNEATEEQIDAAIEQLGAKADTVQSQFTNTKTDLETKLEAETKKVTTANEATTAVQTQFANAVAAAGKTIGGIAVKTGLITGAEQPVWVARLSNPAQFTNELTALGALEPKVKTGTALNRPVDSAIDLSTPQKRTQFVNSAVETLATERKVNATIPAVRRGLEDKVYRAYPDLKAKIKRSAHANVH